MVFSAPPSDTDDGIFGFELTDPNGHILFFGGSARRDVLGAMEAADPEMDAQSPRIESVQPVLMVRDVPAAIAFYARLGFELAFADAEDAPTYAGVRRDGAELHLQWHAESAWQHPGDRPSYRFPVPHVERLFDELRSGSTTLDMTELRATPWGTREFHVRDLDGNGLQFYVGL